MQKFLRILAQFGVGSYFFQRLLRSVDRHMMLSGKNPESLDVVGMLVGDDHPVQFRTLKANLVQPLLNALVADPGIHQNVGLVGAHINAVSAAAAGNAY